MATHALRHIGLFIASAVCAGVLAFFVIMLVRVLPCTWSNYQPNSFYAYCDTSAFGDYEHAALIRGLEPDAVENLKRADVVFLGTSRMMHAFSTKATQQFFAQHQLRYFVLGFGYGEHSLFALNILKKYDVHPAMLVINIDPYFASWQSDVANESMEEGLRVDARFLLKKFLYRTAQQTCQRLPFLCSNSYGGWHRSAENGQWLYTNKRVIPFLPVTREMPLQDLADTVTDGESFLDQVGTKRDCVVLTGVPSPQYDSENMAIRTSTVLRTKLHLAHVDGLSTFDGFHLSNVAAERWSAEFFRDFAPHLKDCFGQ